LDVPRIAAVVAAGVIAAFPGANSLSAATLSHHSGTGSNHLSTAHRSLTGTRASKTSSNRGTNSSRTHPHKASPASKAASRDRSRDLTSGDAPQVIDRDVHPEANVQVELPSHDLDDDYGAAEDDDQSSILLGRGYGNENEDGNNQGPFSD
jgi:hypothetical protein